MSSLRLRDLFLTLGVASALAAGCAANPVAPTDGGPTAREDGAVIPSEDGAAPMGDGSVPLPDGAVECTDAPCAAGDTRCSGADVQRCEVSDATGCPAWSEAGDCGGGQVCSADECRDSCIDACTDGGRRCASDGSFQQCTTQSHGCLDWSPEESCPTDEVCVGEGACQACTDGDRRCSSATSAVQECVAGRWTDIESCAFGCTSAACEASIACTAGNYRCNGTNVETCNSSGTAWLHVRTCSVACASGLCTGACTPGATRCNGARAETCNAAGTGWDMTADCASTFCAGGGCALAGLEVATAMTLDGDVFVDGAVIVRSGATVTSSTGALTLHADSITIENDASISVAPTGETAEGAGRDGYYYSYYGRYYGGGGGSYGTRGTGGAGSGPIWGSANDADVQPGSPGGEGYGGTGSPGLGGGVLRLIADTIVIAGQATANGGNGSSGSTSAGGGGSGGGLLIAGDDVTITGTVSAIGGTGGTGSSYRAGGNGGDGRVKVLYGSSLDETGASINGAVVRGLLPPLELSSSTHPDPDRVYNDGFPLVAMSWNRPWSPITGYYWLEDTAELVPTPSNAEFVATELVSFDVADIAEGDNFFQIVPVNPMATVGAVEGSFRIQLNRTPPAPSSTSHASPTTWSTNPNVFISWTLPHDAENYRGTYYVFDHFGDTVPTTADNFVPVSQLQVLLSGVADGIWGFHVVSVDTQGYLTQEAGHYQVRIGADPGEGTVFGQVTDGTTSSPIPSARVTVNRELLGGQATNSTGNYNLASIPAGAWELRVTAEGYRPATQMVTVTDGMSTAANVSLMPE